MSAGTRRAFFLIVLFLGVSAAPASSRGHEEGQKVAEGEYLTRGEAKVDSKQPIGDQYEIREAWTLWRLADHKYRVIGEVKFDIDHPYALEYELELSSDLDPIVFRTWAPAMQGGGLSFAFGERELHYQLEGKDLQKLEEAKQEVEPPYTLFPAISWWLLAGITRHAPQVRGGVASVRLIFFDDDDPIDMTPIDAEIRFLGSEDTVVAGVKHGSRKYQLTGTGNRWPDITLWVSDEGLVVAAKGSESEKPQTVLVMYEKYAEFGPGK